MAVIPVLRRLRQEDRHKFKPNLGCIATTCFKITRERRRGEDGGGREEGKEKGTQINNL